MGGLQVGAARQPAAGYRGERVDLVPVPDLPVGPGGAELWQRRCVFDPLGRVPCLLWLCRPLRLRLPAGSGSCPQTFSIVGLKSWQDPAWGTWPDNQNGTFPFNRNSTAFAVDYLGGELRGCYEGWESWLKTTGTRGYAAGDLWGCVGTWYAGAWHTGAADSYIDQVRRFMQSRPWLDPTWPEDKPGCTSSGCPGPDPL